jgi:hypothetical protein
MTIYAMLDVVEKLEEARLDCCKLLALWLLIWYTALLSKGLVDYSLRTHFFLLGSLGSQFKICMYCVFYEIDGCDSIYRWKKPMI